MRITMFMIALILASGTLKGQSLDRDYRTAIGVKIWDGGGLSIKHFTSGNNAIEGIGYLWDKGFRLTGLYEIHRNIAGAPGLKWYIGPGAHVGFYDENKNTNDGSKTYIGVDGVIGLDFKFNKIPINLSIDWQPSFEFGDGRGFNGGWGGLGIRYAFGK